MRSTWIWIASSVIVIAICGGGWWWAQEQRYRRDLAQAEKDMAGGRYRPARDLLAEIVSAAAAIERSRLSAWSLRRKPRTCRTRADGVEFDRRRIPALCQISRSRASGS